jgi:hypothetical protein
LQRIVIRERGGQYGGDRTEAADRAAGVDQHRLARVIRARLIQIREQNQLDRMIADIGHVKQHIRR